MTAQTTGEIVAGGTPGSKRILEDINKVVESVQKIFDADGVVVRGLGNRVGNRRDPNDPVAQRGGNRTKKQQYSSGAWAHPDARDAWDRCKTESKECFKQKLDRLGSR